MDIRKKGILVNILVICLYFLWPYLFSLISNLSNNIYLYISFAVNFLFLFIVIYIYNNKLLQYYKNFRKKFKFNMLNSLKIFLIGLILYVLFNFLFESFNVPVLNNSETLMETMKKIPVLFILNSLFYYPIIEEIIFKMSFKDIFKNKWSFIIITGVFNALFQIVFSFNGISDLLYLIPCSIFFCSLSYIYYKTNNIMYPIFLRICYNIIPCIIFINRIFN